MHLKKRSRNVNETRVTKITARKGADKQAKNKQIEKLKDDAFTYGRHRTTHGWNKNFVRPIISWL